MENQNIEQEVLDNIGKVAYALDKTYLSQLKNNYSVLSFDKVNTPKEEKDGKVIDKNGLNVDYINNVRALKIKKWVYDKEEKTGDCFKNVLSLFADGEHTIALVINRKKDDTEMYFVVKNTGAGKGSETQDKIDLLDKSLKGNFAGTETEIIEMGEKDKDIGDTMNRLFSFEDNNSVSVLTNIPSEFSKDYVTQGLDKLLNGVVPKDEDEEYTVVFLLESLYKDQIREILTGYEELATGIAPFQQYQFTFGENTVATQGETKSIANSKSVSNSITKTHSINVGISGGVNGSVGAGITTGLGWIATALVTATTTIGASLGLNLGYGYSWGKTKTNTEGTTESVGTNNSISTGETKSNTYTHKSYTITNLIQKLELIMKHITESQSVGLWKYSTYVFAKDINVSQNVANFLRSTTQGKESYVEPAVIQHWSYENDNKQTTFEEIRKFVSHFMHPIFAAKSDDNTVDMVVTPTSYVATTEIGNVISFPRASLQGIPVLECAKFARNIVTYDNAKTEKQEKTIKIGKVNHMHHPEEVDVNIALESLKSHAFITGSTGSGKSNTVYTLLQKAVKEDIKFMVIEPAKGEYKNVFALAENEKCKAKIYGTNPLKTPLLRINPFSFDSEHIHIFEHLDRLIEIFNVCWAMYAAMPAVLKSAIEKSYKDCGWDLVTSRNKYNENIFPTFADVSRNVKEIIDTSDYDNENKGAYKGSLITRLNSLTNGVYSMIFTNNEMSMDDLFKENTIIDLSRLGSTETKSLIMGMLVLKLQEYRMSEEAGMNQPLKHLTVLEEAHNLLKRTSTEQPVEGGNLIGKSVEMISNAIAEMRTYGEGFIIVDQAPGLLDMSAIRNTNTKIIMRLPDEGDRKLVGKSANLNDDQIIEIAKLPRGVAAIYQNEWVQPLLCSIECSQLEEKNYEKEVKQTFDFEKENLTTQSLLNCLMDNEIYNKEEKLDIKALKNDIIISNLDALVKTEFLDFISVDADEKLNSLRKLVYDFFNSKEAIENAENCDNIEDWVKKVVKGLSPDVTKYNNQQIDLLMSLIIYEQSIREIGYNDILNSFVEKFRTEGRVY